MPGIPDVENVDLTADFESREYLAGLDVEDRIIVETGNGGRLIGEVDTDLLDRRSRTMSDASSAGWSPISPILTTTSSLEAASPFASGTTR